MTAIPGPSKAFIPKVPRGRPESMNQAPNTFDVSPSGSMILDALHRAKVISRADLAGFTGLPQQSVHRATAELIDHGLINVLPPRISGRGKPSPLLQVRADSVFGVGLAIDTDIGRVCIADLDGSIRWQARLATDTNDPGMVLADAGRLARQAIAELGLPPGRIAGVGVSMQGYRNTRDRTVLADTPAYAENNATLGAIAELWAGAGRQYTTFVNLSFNYGFGAGIIVDGRPHRGGNLNAGEISRIFTDNQKSERPALGNLLRELQRDGLDIQTIDALRLHYDPTWPAIDRWIGIVNPHVDLCLRAISALLDPDAVIFGGEAPADLRRRLIDAATPPTGGTGARALPAPKLVMGREDDDPSLLGAALLPILTRLFRW
jgi:predicted NBD/HSP70 family sugar kinase